MVIVTRPGLRYVDDEAARIAALNLALWAVTIAPPHAVIVPGPGRPQ